MYRLFLGITLASLMLLGQQPRTRLERQVRHELITLPFLGVFDNLSFKVDGSRVTLYGQVTRPTLRSSAERVVKDLEGIEVVDNQIEVLPLSPNDDRIRIAAWRAIYGYPALQRYQLGSIAPIRIIVKNGNITLEGVVLNEGDKNIAGIRANGVPGAFSVTNNLLTETRSAEDDPGSIMDRANPKKDKKKGS